MARYLERAEHTARLIDVQLNLMLDQSSESADQRWNRILACLGSPLPPESPRDAFSLTRSLVFDPQCRSSIVSCILSARENARQVRQQISSEMWEQVNRLYHEVRREGMDELWDRQPSDFIFAVERGLHLFQGITDSTLNHGEGWNFIQIGRYLERSMATAVLLDVQLREIGNTSETTDIHLDWITLLRSCTAFEAYCRVHTADLQPGRIAEFLLLNNEFPHSIRFSADRLQSAIAKLPEAETRGHRVARLAGRLNAELSFVAIDDLIASDLHEYLARIEKQCGQIHAALQECYIDYSIEEALTD
jgi:uncharacterized alpha-E superfamily protein